MPIDPRTPVLVGYGQVNQHDENPDVEPVDLMVQAARAAADPRLLEAVDAVRVVNLLSWRYRDPGLLLAQRIRADKAVTRYTGIGGNVPQTLVNMACLDIQQGKADVVLIAGAETWRTRSRIRAAGRRPDWTKQDESVPSAPGGDESVPMAAPSDIRINLDRPAYVYPMFEQALRIAAGETPDEHRRRIGELWAQFSAVAADNPHAWNREALTPEQIWQPSASNRMISWPYTKLMNSNNMVDQGAVLIVASAEKARHLQIPSDRWVFPYAGADSHDTYAIAERAEFHTSPAIRIAGRRALELAGAGVDDMDLVDVYSCFPSAVQVAARELGLPVGKPDRPLTVTGGLTFAGGPWNNYVTHSIATMAERLAAQPGQRGLITANGGYLTKHSFGVYGTEPPKHEFRWEDVQSEVDREPTRTAVVEWSGVGTVESWTTPVDRDGAPEKAFLAVRTPEDARVLAVITDRAGAEATVRDDIAGAAVRVHADGTASLE
ncbi:MULTISPECIES: acetyl-CoA acetyltransferase [Mycolicibacterium]|jgi:acetyl-CoA C-acetyltransferase|uniref:Acetyl-CoA acetyltransferase n=2 Tax=Mycolicibacterium TaxID=1866885 RepID=A0ABT8HDE3_MYCAO|nr:MULTISPECIES: acetyl-CoA acetyltransferase [Mycolicibacterium]MDN4518790.1 acetyl-CoA acetyltransferase [Mycolicibacterium austroafricanum]MDW5609895.1 acetyl-CoA acetyltransferase [Mycolicibacterium sp. D5.8-2]QRZ09615.1 acetyl-CoA acetyltransferase [Mycolicibacterium austroafricanum]QZT66028.1 acetyl-CoA acetyltransferase [Mycolicibacterium austroafricanum]QZY43780.1 acetyl-CoA acetyltransferase [Mycolicibacterium austroafricanum]